MEQISVDVCQPCYSVGMRIVTGAQITREQLNQIKGVIDDPNLCLVEPATLQSAYDTLNWGEAEIRKACMRLKPVDCYSTKQHGSIQGRVYYYFRRNALLRGQNVYIHLCCWADAGGFHVVIDSCKEL